VAGEVPCGDEQQAAAVRRGEGLHRRGGGVAGGGSAGGGSAGAPRQRLLGVGADRAQQLAAQSEGSRPDVELAVVGQPVDVGRVPHEVVPEGSARPEHGEQALTQPGVEAKGAEQVRRVLVGRRQPLQRREGEVGVGGSGQVGEDQVGLVAAVVELQALDGSGGPGGVEEAPAGQPGGQRAPPRVRRRRDACRQGHPSTSG